MLRRRLKLFGKILLGFVALLMLFLLVERWRGQIALAGFKKELRAKGEKLSPQDFVTTFAEADNGAPTIFAAISNLQSGVVLPDSYPPRMQLLASGHAIIGFREAQWVERDPHRAGQLHKGLVTNRWDQLAADLETNRKLLTEIGVALEKPVLDNHLDLSGGLQMKFPGLTPTKALTYWFGSASQYALHAGRTHDAVPDLVAQIRLPRLLARNHTVISELVRIAIASVAKTDTWEALQADGWASQDLKQLQDAWESEDFARSMVASLEGERVYMLACSRQLRASNDDTYEMMFGPYANLFGEKDEEETGWYKLFQAIPYGEEVISGLRKQVFCRLWRFAWADQDELRCCQEMQNLIDITRSATTNASNASVKIGLSALEESPKKKNFYDRLRFPQSGSTEILFHTIEKAMKIETDRSLCIAAIALKRYSLHSGRPPERLNQLVPDYLTVVPIDYMDGKPIKYQPNEGGTYSLYSVGEDGADDGGDLSLPPGKEAKGYLWLRKDYIWPAPATPQEVEEYRRKSNTD